MLWFLAIAAIGVVHIVREPAILAALDPREAARFISSRLALAGSDRRHRARHHRHRGAVRRHGAISAVVRSSSRTAWVLPALALNYMAGALLISYGRRRREPVLSASSPAALLVPSLVLATLAAIIASQAVISGAYSMTRQAIQLGFLPRMTVRSTSAVEAGQIYVPLVNTVLLLGVLAATLHFGSSGALAGAYGIAVTMTMAITTLLTYFVAEMAGSRPRRWRSAPPASSSRWTPSSSPAVR
ncbi:MAG: KUP/HAK/KT family potassium transporter [Rubrivivax sp.]